jgi:hypothetical protein
MLSLLWRSSKARIKLDLPAPLGAANINKLPLAIGAVMNAYIDWLANNGQA